MTPERIEEIAAWACGGLKLGYAPVMEMLAEIERLQNLVIELQDSQEGQ